MDQVQPGSEPMLQAVLANRKVNPTSQIRGSRNGPLVVINSLAEKVVIGAKPRANLVSVHVVPQSDAKKWRNSMAFVPTASVCCTCVPRVLPLVPITTHRGSNKCETQL